jgi:NADPH:quinone reductase-like Zn-dependent oxidoreductase
MTESIRVWELSAFGRRHLALATRPLPVPGPGEILVKTGAVSLNYRDKVVVDGDLLKIDARFPLVPLSDMAGTVAAVGFGVTRFQVGDRVASHFRTRWLDGVAPHSQAEHVQTLGVPLTGVLAEYVVLPDYAAVASPASLGDIEAATLPIAALTAWYALVDQGRLRAGQSVLVQGTGGVALFGMQFARLFGARAIVTSRHAEKLARARALGATDVIDTTATPDWANQALALTGGQGVDHILDVLGGAAFAQSLKAVAPEGRVTSVGFMGDMEARFSVIDLLIKRAIVQGSSVGHRQSFEAMNAAIDRHGLKPVIDTVYPFDQAPRAFDHLDRGAFGKLVIALDRRS